MTTHISIRRDRTARPVRSRRNSRARGHARARRQLAEVRHRQVGLADAVGSREEEPQALVRGAEVRIVVAIEHAPFEGVPERRREALEVGKRALLVAGRYAGDGDEVAAGARGRAPADARLGELAAVALHDLEAGVPAAFADGQFSAPRRPWA